MLEKGSQPSLVRRLHAS